MNEFFASIDRKRLLINVVGYLVILFLYLIGPKMGGFLGGAIRGYLIVFPAYYLGYNYLRYRGAKDRGE